MLSHIWAVPGFLGLAADWNFLQLPFLEGVNIYDFPWSNLSNWAIEFNRSISRQKVDCAILMGYSLGGRLALHALLDQPQQWQAAIIISAHPGLTNQIAREERQQKDQKWAHRFEKEEWFSLMQSWNSQEIFIHDSFCFPRYEHHYQRQLLSQTLIDASLGQQVNLRTQIADLNIPLLWITGDQDKKYCDLAQTLTFRNSASYWVKIHQAGHRAPWNQPILFSKSIKIFLNKIGIKIYS